jgi:hypothetical protein
MGCPSITGSLDPTPPCHCVLLRKLVRMSHFMTSEFSSCMEYSFRTKSYPHVYVRREGPAELYLKFENLYLIMTMSRAYPPYYPRVLHHHRVNKFGVHCRNLPTKKTRHGVSLSAPADDCSSLFKGFGGHGNS